MERRCLHFELFAKFSVRSRFNMHSTQMFHKSRISLAGLYSSDISEAEEVIPRKVSHKGEFVSHNLTTFHDDQHANFNISFNNEDHLLILKPSRGFISPAAIVQRHKRDVHVRYKPKQASTNCHFQGTVHGKPNSKVALSACNGLVRRKSDRSLCKVTSGSQDRYNTHGFREILDRAFAPSREERETRTYTFDL